MTQHSRPGLDVARGLAALTVFASHISQMFFWKFAGAGSSLAFWTDIASNGAVGVFFVLSGHLITRSILQNIQRNGGFSPTEYLASRVSRIYPPLIGAIGLSVLVWAAIRFGHLPGSPARPMGLPGDLFSIRQVIGLRPTEIPSSLLMLGGLEAPNGPLWSLYVEFQLYLVAMCAACWWRGTRFAAVLSTLVALSALMLLRGFPVWCAVWGLGALTAALRWRPGAGGHHWPKALIGAGNASYSLYVVHFPLLLLALSLTQGWVGHDLPRQAIVAGVSAVVVLALAVGFARVAENQRLWKRLLTS